MAIYHFSGKLVSRSQGRSVVACAAYRSGTCLEDERTEITHDYTRKEDVVHAEILVPENAPEWMKDRSTLWNTVERVEKRKDAQLARDFHFSLPRELNNDQNIALAREFIKKEFVDRGMVADFAVHDHVGSDGERQPHAHVLLSLREITPEGFGQKERSWNDKKLLLHFREAWADTANRHLALQGYDVQIDHRSNRAQGIDLEPQHKIGAAVVKEQLAKFEDHQRIAHENGERIFNDPSIALDALTRQQSTFTHQDIARFVNRHTVDATQFEKVFDHVKLAPELVSLGKDEKGQDRFTTQEMLETEKQLMENAITLSNSTQHAVSEHTQQKTLERYPTLSPEQKAAFTHLMQPHDLGNVVGYAGTGKNFMINVAREAWEKEGYRVKGAALAGIAAEGLNSSAGIESRTLASYVASWDRGEKLLSKKDVLVVDEAGLIGSRQMSRVMEEVHRAGAKIVLIGDHQQLQAIEAGAAFRGISEKTGYVELTEIRRQETQWQREATKELAQGDIQKALQRYDSHHHVHDFETREAAKQGMVELWNDSRISEPDKTHLMLAYTRDDVRDLNEQARKLRQANQELGQDYVIKTHQGERNFATGDKVYFLRNDRDLGVMNGTLGTITHMDEKKLQIQIDSSSPNPRDRKTVNIDPVCYEHLDHGYATTFHKSQGATVDRSYLLASRHVDRHAAYVGLSRHRDSTELCWSRDEFKHFTDLGKNFARDRSKDMSVDYQQPFSENRSITPLPDPHTPHHDAESC